MLIYVRHGVVAPAGEPDRMRRMTDRLTPEGRDQAKLVGQYLKGIQPTTFTTSPLPRAEEFARIIGGVIGVHPTVDPNLETWKTGELSGQKVSDVKEYLTTYIKNSHRPVLGGEALDTAIQRLSPAIKQRVLDPGVHLVVGHGRGVTVLDGLASPVGGVGGDVDPKFLHAKPSVQNGGIVAVSPTWSKQIVHAHLKG